VGLIADHSYILQFLASLSSLISQYDEKSLSFNGKGRASDPIPSTVETIPARENIVDYRV
jgi:hypothetical protein